MPCVIGIELTYQQSIESEVMPHFHTFADSIDRRLTVTRAPGQLLQSSSQNTFLLKDTSNYSNALWRSANNISGGEKA